MKNITLAMDESAARAGARLGRTAQDDAQCARSLSCSPQRSSRKIAIAARQARHEAAHGRVARNHGVRTTGGTGMRSMPSVKIECFLDTNILIYAASGKRNDPRKFADRVPAHPRRPIWRHGPDACRVLQRRSTQSRDCRRRASRNGSTISDDLPFVPVDQAYVLAGIRRSPGVTGSNITMPPCSPQPSGSARRSSTRKTSTTIRCTARSGPSIRSVER